MIPRRFNYLNDQQRPTQPIGPRRPEPFSDGKKTKLLPCPTCKQKGLLYYYAPTELGYVTECIKCGQKYRYQARSDMSTKELRAAGGFTPRIARVLRKDPKTGREVLDADRLWDDILERRDVGWKRWRSLGKERRPDRRGRLV